jgi:hypothetical protein
MSTMVLCWKNKPARATIVKGQRVRNAVFDRPFCSEGRRKMFVESVLVNPLHIWQLFSRLPNAPPPFLPPIVVPIISHLPLLE